MQLIVLGMHRSGTSVLARLLNMMGVYFGPEGISTGAGLENAKGFWERKDVRALNDWVLQSAGFDWNRVSRFDPDRLPEPVVSEFISHASRLILELDAHRPWLMKEPRLCLLFGLWRRVLEIPVCIHIHRSPVEVAASLQTRNGMPIEVGMAMWEAYVVQAHLASAGLPEVSVAHRLLMEAPFMATEALHGELERLQVPGLRMPSQREIDAFIERGLYRERDSRKDLERFKSSAQNKLFDAIVAGKDFSARLKQGVHPASIETLALYESSLTPPKAPTPIPKLEPVGIALREKLAAQAQEVKMLREEGVKLEAHARLRESRLSDELVTLGKLQENASLREQELRTATTALGNLQTELKHRDAKLREAEQGESELRRSIGNLEAELKKRDARLLEAEQGESELRRSIGNLETELGKRDGRLEEAQHDLSELRHDLGRCEATREIREGKVRSLEDALRKLEAEHKIQKARSASSREAFDRTEAERRKLETECRSLRSNVDERFDEIVTLTRLLMDRERVLNEALSEQAVTRKALDSKSTQLAQARADLASAGVEMARNASQLKALTDEFVGLKSSRSWRMLTSVASIKNRLGGRLLGREHAIPDAALVTRSRLFDKAWYLKTYPDVAESGVDPIEHYLQFGAAEGRDPGPEFSTSSYLSGNPDVAAAGINPLVHFIRHGRDEGRVLLTGPDAGRLGPAKG